MRFTPPYCFDCTPLDNGAFGWVKRFVMRNGGILQHVSIENALGQAFKALKPRRAQEFFRNCSIIV